MYGKQDYWFAHHHTATVRAIAEHILQHQRGKFPATAPPERSTEIIPIGYLRIDAQRPNLASCAQLRARWPTRPDLPDHL